nr:uncharacterized protein LOC112754479 isoform X1 [Arachis hypogaea]
MLLATKRGAAAAVDCHWRTHRTAVPLVAGITDRREGGCLSCCCCLVLLLCGTWKGDKLCSSCRQVRYCSEKHQVRENLVLYLILLHCFYLAASASLPWLIVGCHLWSS